MNKSNVVKGKAKGRWREILGNLAPTLADALKHMPNHVPCPVNGGRDGFRLFKDVNDTGGGISNSAGAFTNGFDLLMWVWDCDFATVLKAVSDYLDVGDSWKNSTNHSLRQPIQKIANVEVKQNEKQRQQLKAVWSQSVKLTHSKAKLALSYLSNRGINVNKLPLDALSKTIRFNPSCALWHTPKASSGDKSRPKAKLVGNFPAIISLVSYADGSPACLHRTYLSLDGTKLNITFDGEIVPTKKLMGRCTNKPLAGGAIRIFDDKFADDSELHVTEGLENALAVMQTIGKPVWPCVNSTLLGLVEPPKGVKRIVDWSDKDREKVIRGKTYRAGTDAAIKLSNRMFSRGIDVMPLFPSDEIPEGEKSVDWNDVLIRHGESAFPSDKVIRTMFM